MLGLRAPLVSGIAGDEAALGELLRDPLVQNFVDGERHDDSVVLAEEPFDLKFSIA